MLKTFRVLSLVSILVLIFSACNLPSGTPTTEPNVVFTAAALTMQAQSTQLAPFNTPTLPPVQPTNTVASPTLAIPTVTRSVPPTASCDQAQFIKDVTIPDGSVIAPGSTFKKTWQLKNIGTCTWSGYQLVFDSGEAMSPVPDPIGTVAPGQEVEVSVTFTAPTVSKTYRSYWRVRNASGVLIPVSYGTDGQSFYLEIKVAAVSSGYDFHTQASSATWTNSIGPLTFGGPDTDPNGFVMFRNGQKLEDGTIHNKILEMHPQWVNDGTISGRYPAYTVVSGEHFTATIGFLALGDGSCGAGNAIFQLNYREGGQLKSALGEWTESCDDVMRAVDVNLSTVVGKTVEFVLIVKANGPATQDTAVWVAPQIALP